MVFTFDFLHKPVATLFLKFVATRVFSYWLNPVFVVERLFRAFAIAFPFVWRADRWRRGRWLGLWKCRKESFQSCARGEPGFAALDGRKTNAFATPVWQAAKQPSQHGARVDAELSGYVQQLECVAVDDLGGNVGIDR
jgi:hypothetical protein